MKRLKEIAAYTKGHAAGKQHHRPGANPCEIADAVLLTACENETQKNRGSYTHGYVNGAEGQSWWPFGRKAK